MDEQKAESRKQKAEAEAEEKKEGISIERNRGAPSSAVRCPFGPARVLRVCVCARGRGRGRVVSCVSVVCPGPVVWEAAAACRT